MHCRPIFPSVRFGSFRFRLKTYHRGTSRKVNMPFNDLHMSMLLITKIGFCDIWQNGHAREQQTPICSTSRARQHPAMTNCHLLQWLDVARATHGVQHAASGRAETLLMHSMQLERVMIQGTLETLRPGSGGVQVRGGVWCLVKDWH